MDTIFMKFRESESALNSDQSLFIISNSGKGNAEENFLGKQISQTPKSL